MFAEFFFTGSSESFIDVFFDTEFWQQLFVFSSLAAFIFSIVCAIVWFVLVIYIYYGWHVEKRSGLLRKAGWKLKGIVSLFGSHLFLFITVILPSFQISQHSLLADVPITPITPIDHPIIA